MRQHGRNSIARNGRDRSKATDISAYEMKKTPFGAFLTPALTGRPPAEIRIDHRLLRVTNMFKRSYSGLAKVASGCARQQILRCLIFVRRGIIGAQGGPGRTLQ